MGKTNKGKTMDDHYDYIVLGTGLEESILAAALSRVGKSVLHVDQNDTYGSEWSTLNLPCFRDFIKSISSEGDSANTHQPDQKARKHLLDSGFADGEDSILLKRNYESDTTVVPTKSSATEDAIGTADAAENDEKIKQFMKDGNRFCIDLMPKLLLSSSTLVELLIRSKVGEYLEFRPLEATCVYSDAAIQQVPCSRSDIFKTKAVSPVEKRFLMRFLKNCIDQEQYETIIAEHSGDKDIPFTQFLASNKLSERLQSFICYAIANAEDKATLSTTAGLERTSLFLKSLGRFGNSPYLYPIYGVAELAQAFCRNCAVFGGVYILDKVPKLINTAIDDGIDVPSTEGHPKLVSSVTFDDATTKCDALIVGPAYRDALCPSTNLPESSVARGVIVSSGPLSVSADGTAATEQFDTITYSYPPGSVDNSAPISVLQLGSKTHVVSEKYWLYHLKTTSDSKKSPRQHFAALVQRLFDSTSGNSPSNTAPTILYEAYFRHTNSSSLKVEEAGLQPSNLHVLGGVDHSLHCSASVPRVQALFDRLCPSEVFLPPAPAQDEIDWDAMTENKADGTEGPDQDKDSPSLESANESESTPAAAE